MNRSELMFIIFNMSLEKKLFDRLDLLKKIIEDFVVLETGIDKEQKDKALSNLEKNLPLPIGVNFYTDSKVVGNIRQIYWKSEHSNSWQLVTSVPAHIESHIPEYFGNCVPKYFKNLVSNKKMIVPISKN